MEDSVDETGVAAVGCDELLLDPEKLARLLYEDEHGGESRDGGDGEMYRYISVVGGSQSVSRSRDLNLTDESDIHVRKVLPAPNTDENNFINDSNEKSEKLEEDKIEKPEAKLPPVRLQKVQSEDLSWLDSIIKHNSLDQAALDSLLEIKNEYDMHEILN